MPEHLFLALEFFFFLKKSTYDRERKKGKKVKGKRMEEGERMQTQSNGDYCFNSKPRRRG